MIANGIMEDIRNLLKDGKPSAEVIGLGYAPSSVYKAQRQLRKASDRTDLPVTQVLVTNMAPEGWSELREENTKLRQQVTLLEELTVERDSLREDLELSRGKAEELEAKARQDQQLRVRMAAIEPEARAAGELRQEVKELGGQIRNTNAAKVQEVQHWKRISEQEQEFRQAAEFLVAVRSSEIDQLKAENQRLSQEVQEMPGRISANLSRELKPIQQELDELRLLKVWVGHPCKVCREPTSGVTTREVAAKMLREGGYAHGDCLKKGSWW